MSNPIAIKESPTLQTRVYVDSFKGKNLVHIRRHVKKDEAWVPTPKGIAVAPEHVDAIIEALKKLKATAIQKASQVATGEAVVKYCIATSKEAASLKKTGFCDTLKDAANKPFPKSVSQTAKMQYKVFKVLITDGAVTRTKIELIRKGDKWVRPLKPKVAK
jgi:hypothetical protein